MGEEFVIHRYSTWRQLCIRRWGPANGFPVFLLHGTPGCRLSPRPGDPDLRQLGVHLITYDRPGYGRSAPHPGRCVADAADDVRAIADELGFQQFAVVGRSGGGPHALACAALLPDRVTRVASVVGLAPYDAPGLDWFKGMAEINRRQYGAALLGRGPLRQVVFPEVVAMRSDPEHLLRGLDAQATAQDRERLRDPDYRAAFAESIRESVRDSLDGWLSDSLAFTRPWRFDPAWIGVPTLLWHGGSDVFSPLAHARWLAGRIPHVVLRVSEHLSHLATAGVHPDVLRWLLQGDAPGRLAG